MLTRAQKEEQVAELKTKFARATSVFVAEYRGLGVHPVDVLRRKMRAEGKGAYEYRVAKNTLLRRAAEGSVVECITSHFKGPTAVAISFGDPVAPREDPRRLREGSTSGSCSAARCSMGVRSATAEIATLATLPSLDELRGKLVGLLQAPAAQLARLMVAPGGSAGPRRGSAPQGAGRGGSSRRRVLGRAVRTRMRALRARDPREHKKGRGTWPI